jgi:hypothetical protein
MPCLKTVPPTRGHLSLCRFKVVSGKTSVDRGHRLRAARSELEAGVLVLLGGRTDEIVVIGEATLGPEGDLRAAADLVLRRYVSGGLGAALIQPSPSDSASDP